MEPITLIAASAGISAVTSALVVFAKEWRSLHNKRSGHVLLKFDVNGKEVHVEYNSSDKLNPEELNEIVERLKSASK